MNRTKKINANELNDIVSIPEAASFFGVSERTIASWIKTNEIKSFKMGSARLMLKQDILGAIGYSELREPVKKPAIEEKTPQNEPQFLNDEVKRINEKTSKVRVVAMPKSAYRGSYEAMTMGA